MNRITVLSVTTSLVAAVCLGCGGSDDPQGSPVANELVGQWQTAIAAPPGISDYARGKLPDIPDIIQVQSSVLGIAFYFWADGRYQLVWLWETAYAGYCGREMSWDERGTLDIEGSAWTFRPSSAMFRMLDSCAPELTTETPIRADEGTITVTRDLGTGGAEHLRLEYPSGGTLVLDKLIE